MDDRGQAFSTFQLLIAAIVAIVILVILLGVLRIIPIITGPGDPTAAASDKIKEAVASLSTHVMTESAVTFDPGTVVTNKAIANKAQVGLEPDQICLSLGDFTDDDSWEAGSEGQSVTYKKSNRISKNVRLSVLCDVANDLEDDITNYYTNAGLNSDWVSNCKCVTETTLQDQVCCVVMLRYERP